MLARILHIILAFLLLVSSTGFTLSTHYCGGKLVDVAVFGEARDCYGNSDRASCLATEQKPRCKKGCCHSSSDYYDADLELLQTSYALTPTNFPQLTIVPALLPSVNTIPAISILTSLLPPYRPPIVHDNFAVWFQVFRL